MILRFQCRCGQKISAKAEHAGRRVRCPKCELMLEVPMGREAAPVAMVPVKVAASPAAQEPLPAFPPVKRKTAQKPASRPRRPTLAEPDMLVPLESESPPARSRLALWLSVAGGAVATGIIALVLIFNSRSKLEDDALAAGKTGSKSKSESQLAAQKQPDTRKSAPALAPFSAPPKGPTVVKQKPDDKPGVVATGKPAPKQSPMPAPPVNPAVDISRVPLPAEIETALKDAGYDVPQSGVTSTVNAVNGSYSSREFTRDCKHKDGATVNYQISTSQFRGQPPANQITLKWSNSPAEANLSRSVATKIGPKCLAAVEAAFQKYTANRTAAQQQAETLLVTVDQKSILLKFRQGRAAGVGNSSAKPTPGSRPPGSPSAGAASAKPFEDVFQAGQIAWQPVKNVKLSTMTGGGRKTTVSSVFTVRFKYDAAGRRSEDTTGQKTYKWLDREATFGPGAVIRLTAAATVREGTLRAGDEWTWSGQRWMAGRSDSTPTGAAPGIPIGPLRPPGAPSSGAKFPPGAPSSGGAFPPGPDSQGKRPTRSRKRPRATRRPSTTRTRKSKPTSQAWTITRVLQPAALTGPTGSLRGKLPGVTAGYQPTGLAVLVTIYFPTDPGDQFAASGGTTRTPFGNKTSGVVTNPLTGRFHLESRNGQTTLRPTGYTWSGSKGAGERTFFFEWPQAKGRKLSLTAFVVEDSHGFSAPLKVRAIAKKSRASAKN